MKNSKFIWKWDFPWLKTLDEGWKVVELKKIYLKTGEELFERKLEFWKLCENCNFKNWNSEKLFKDGILEN